MDIHSTVKTCPKMPAHTSGPNSGRRPHTPKPGPQNLCCRRPLPSKNQMHDQAGRGELKSLKKMHARLSGFGKPLTNWKGTSESYAQRRMQFVGQHPALVNELVRIEVEHERR